MGERGFNRYGGGSMRHYIKLHEDDNVIVALTDLESGSTLTINGEPLIVKENIKQGHKIAISKNFKQ